MKNTANNLSKIIDKIDNMINELDDIKTELLQINCYGKPLKWAEIRADHFDEEEGLQYIDAWLTGDDNEEGKVIAKINLETKEVEYLDEDAKTDPYAQEVINEILTKD